MTPPSSSSPSVEDERRNCRFPPPEPPGGGSHPSSLPHHASPHLSLSPGHDESKAKRIWESYLYGQLANVAKAAVWWSMFGTLVITLMGADCAVGITRAAFNFALVVISPVAGAVAERTSIRLLLDITTFGRMIIWSFLVPACWMVINNMMEMKTVFWIIFISLMFLDGIQVAFANVVDIDCGGLDSLSNEYDLAAPDYLRTRFNSIHQMVFDLSFIIFTPPIALALHYLSHFLPFTPSPEPVPPSPPSPPSPDDKLMPSSVLVMKRMGAISGVSNGGGTGGLNGLDGSNSHNIHISTLGDSIAHSFGISLPRPVNYTGPVYHDDGLSLKAPTSIPASLTYPPSSLDTSSRSPASSISSISLGIDPFSPVDPSNPSSLALHSSSSSLAITASNSLSDVSLSWPSWLSGVSGAGEYFSGRFDTSKLWGHDPGVLALVLGVSTVFFFLSLVSLIFYMRGLPRKSPSYSTSDMGNVDAASDSSSIPPHRSLLAETRDRLRDVKEGFEIVVKEKPLGWRLVFLALETALEDSMVSVVIPEVALHSTKLFADENHRALANVWAVCVIAVGKMGGCLAGLYMNTYWSAPSSYSRDSSYSSLFWCALASSASLLLLPIARFLVDVGSPVWISCLLVFFSSFIFFVFSTAPKIGFAILLQGLVTSQHVAGKVFGFVGTFVTITDALVITIINLVFSLMGHERFLLALIIVAIAYLLHGLAEAILGPRLILEPPNAREAGLNVFGRGGMMMSNGNENDRSAFFNSNFPLASEPPSTSSD